MHFTSSLGRVVDGVLLPPFSHLDGPSLFLSVRVRRVFDNMSEIVLKKALRR